MELNLYVNLNVEIYIKSLNFNMSLGIKRIVVVRKDSVHNDSPKACSMEFETWGVLPKSLWSKQKAKSFKKNTTSWPLHG
jgi:hypothetical protein